MTPKDVINHPEILALAGRCQQDEERKLRSCIDGLCRQGPADIETLVQATKKAFDAITGKLRILLSYKRKQHAAFAEKFTETLQAFGNDKIDVFFDEVKLEEGHDWYNSIKKHLKSANCLVLLVPDDSEEREWPIFEAAFFAGRMLPGERLIACTIPPCR